MLLGNWSESAPFPSGGGWEKALDFGSEEGRDGDGEGRDGNEEGNDRDGK